MPPGTPIASVDTAGVWLSFDAVAGIQDESADVSVTAAAAASATDSSVIGRETLQSLLLLAEMDAVHSRNCALVRACRDLERQIDSFQRLDRSRSLTSANIDDLANSAPLAASDKPGRRLSARDKRVNAISSPARNRRRTGSDADEPNDGSSSPGRGLRRTPSNKSTSGRNRSGSGSSAAGGGGSGDAFSAAAAAATAAVAASAAELTSSSSGRTRSTATDYVCRVTVNVKVAESSAAAVLRRPAPAAAPESIFVDTAAPPLAGLGASPPPVPAWTNELDQPQGAADGSESGGGNAGDSDAFIKAMLIIRVENLLDSSMQRDGDLLQMRFTIDPVEGVERRRRQEELLAAPSLAAGGAVTLRAFLGVLPRAADTVTLPSVLQYSRRDGSVHLLDLMVSLPSSRSKLAALVSSATSSPASGRRTSLPAGASSLSQSASGVQTGDPKQSPRTALALTSSTPAMPLQPSPAALAQGRRGLSPQRSPRSSPRSPRAMSPRPRSPRARSPRAMSPGGNRARSPRARSPRARSPTPRAASPRGRPRSRSRGRSPARGRSPTRGRSPSPRGDHRDGELSPHRHHRGMSPGGGEHHRAVSPSGRRAFSPRSRPTSELMPGAPPLVGSPGDSNATFGGESPASPARGRARTVLENMVRSLSPSRAKSPERTPAAAMPSTSDSPALAQRADSRNAAPRAKSPLRQMLRALSPSRSPTTPNRQQRHTVSGMAPLVGGGGDDANRRRAGTNLPPPRRLYGVTVEKMGDKITPFDIPVRWLEDHAQICEGLFRQSGSSEQIEMLCSLIDSGQSPYLDASFDPYTVAGVLQRFLLELPEPLLTYRLYDDFINSVDAPPALLRALVRSVPDRQRYMLVRLMRLLGAVHDNAAMTLMPAANLAVVFAPSLLRHRDPLTAMRTMRTSIAVVQRLIVERGEVLGKRAAAHPQHAYTEHFSTLEAEAVERIFTAQREMNKLVTRDQQLAALAAAEKRHNSAAPSGVHQAQRPGSVLTPAAVVAMLQATPPVGTLSPDAKVPSVPLPTPASLETAMVPPSVPSSLAPSARSSEADFTQNNAITQARARAATMPADPNDNNDDDFIPPLPNNPEMFEDLPAPPLPSASSARAALVATYMAEMSSRSSNVSADTMRLRDAEEEDDVQSLMSTVIEDD